jgi:hypothetical protein
MFTDGEIEGACGIVFETDGETGLGAGGGVTGAAVPVAVVAVVGVGVGVGVDVANAPPVGIRLKPSAAGVCFLGWTFAWWCVAGR